MKGDDSNRFFQPFCKNKMFNSFNNFLPEFADCVLKSFPDKQVNINKTLANSNIKTYISI